MTLEEFKNVQGNVCKIKHGKRTAYYAYYSITPIDETGDVLGYEVDKTGFPRTSKYGLIH